jgi:hypothetical protein
LYNRLNKEAKEKKGNVQKKKKDEVKVEDMNEGTFHCGVKELKCLLALKNLPVSGTKAVLQQR